MALVFCDGFDHMTTLHGLNQYDHEVAINYAGLNVTSADNQYIQKWERGWDQGDPSLMAYTSWLRRPQPSSWPIGYFVANNVWYPFWMYRHFNEDHYDTLIVGFAFLGYPGFNQPQSPEVEFYNYDNEEVCRIVPIDGNGRVTMKAGNYNGNIQTLYSDTNVTEELTWYHCEAKWVFDDSTGGSMECRINETVVIQQTGIQTYKSGGDSEGNFSFSQVKIGKGLHNTFFLDDFYILDGEGTVANDFVGDSRIDTIFPTSNGYYSEFTPSTGGNNYECCEGGIWEWFSGIGGQTHQYYHTGIDYSRYNESETLGDKDTYDHNSLLALSKPIHAIQQNSNFRKTDAGKKQVEQIVRTYSTDYYTGNVIDVPDFYRNYYWPWTVNPYTLVAWTEAEVNAMESGIEIAY